MITMGARSTVEPRRWPTYVWVPLVAALMLTLPYLLYKSNETAVQRGYVLSAIAETSPLYREMFSRFENGPVHDAKPVDYEEAKSIEPLDFTGFEILSNSRIFDLRGGTSSSAGRDSALYLHSRIRVRRYAALRSNDLIKPPTYDFTSTSSILMDDTSSGAVASGGKSSRDEWRPLSVEVVHVLGNKMVEMPPSEENELRKTFGFYLRNELFRPAVEIGASLRQGVCPHAVQDSTPFPRWSHQDQLERSNVPIARDDAHNFDAVINRTEEDHVTSNRAASNVATVFWPFLPKFWRRGN